MTREQWLNDALGLCRQFIADRATAIVPDTTRVSCGFPGGGSARTRIGECWPDSASADASTEIFISPVLSAAQTVLATLLHEAIHAAVGCKAGHKAPFKRVAVACGLTGKMTATVASDDLKPILEQWATDLGAYPHAVLSLMGRKKQSTRLIKCECPKCGYVVRTTAKWIEKGAPMCPDEACSDEDTSSLQQMTVQVIESEDAE